MLSQWGPLVGVVVGAILAGAAQVIAGSVQRRHDRSMRSLGKRDETYLKVVDWVAAMSRTMGYLEVAERRGVQSEVSKHVHALHEYTSVTAIMGAAMRLYAPSSTEDAFEAVVKSLRFPDDDLDGDATADEWDEISSEFARRADSMLALMRRDQGTKD